MGLVVCRLGPSGEGPPAKPGRAPLSPHPGDFASGPATLGPYLPSPSPTPPSQSIAVASPPWLPPAARHTHTHTNTRACSWNASLHGPERSRQDRALRSLPRACIRRRPPSAHMLSGPASPVELPRELPASSPSDRLLGRGPGHVRGHVPVPPLANLDRRAAVHVRVQGAHAQRAAHPAIRAVAVGAVGAVEGVGLGRLGRLKGLNLPHCSPRPLLPPPFPGPPSRTAAWRQRTSCRAWRG
jgi:hypothetical protein